MRKVAESSCGGLLDASIPYPAFVDIARRLLFQEGADFLQFAAAGAGIIQEVAKFA